jgi:hypothetical protein
VGSWCSPIEAVRLPRPIHAESLFARIDGLSKRSFQAIKIDLSVLGSNFRKQPEEFLLLSCLRRCPTNANPFTDSVGVQSVQLSGAGK